MYKQSQAQGRASKAVSDIGAWFSGLDKATQGALIGALVGSAGLGAAQALSPAQQDPATGRKRKKGVVSKALLGALLGGTAGAGLGYASQNFSGASAGAPDPDTAAKLPWWSKSLQVATPVAGAGAGTGAWALIEKPNIRGPGRHEAALETALWSTDAKSKISPEEYKTRKALLDKSFGKGGVFERFKSRRYRFQQSRNPASGVGLRRKPVLNLVQRASKATGMDFGSAADIDFSKLNKLKKIRANTLVTLPLYMTAGTVAAEIGRRRYWNQELAEMAPTVTANATEAALRALEGKK